MNRPSSNCLLCDDFPYTSTGPGAFGLTLTFFTVSNCLALRSRAAAAFVDDAPVKRAR